MTGKRLMSALIQFIPLILVVTFICGAIGGYVNYFILQPEYTATTSFYVMAPVDVDAGDDNNSIITYYEKLALDYSEIATSRSITSEVAKNLGLSDGLGNYDIKVSPAEETRVMELTVTGKDAELVKDIANEMVAVFTETVKRVIGAENVNVIDYAYVIRTGPMRAQNTILIALAGAIITVGIIVLKEFLDNTFRNAQEVEELLGLPVLAQVIKIKGAEPDDKNKKKQDGNQLKGGRKGENGKIKE